MALEEFMRPLRFLNVTILAALVGSTALGFAQDEKKEEEKPARQEEPKSQPKQDEAKPPRQDKQSRQQATPEKDKQEHPEMRGERNQQGQERPEARGNHARPAGKGGHIPDEKFRSSFGHEHHFNARTVIVQGQPQFQYGGYSFEFVDAWPAEWAYTDDLYIDYVDGDYFIYDLLHPGIRIAVFLVM
jgi:hypothetical protein